MTNIILFSQNRILNHCELFSLIIYTSPIYKILLSNQSTISKNPFPFRGPNGSPIISCTSTVRSQYLEPSFPSTQYIGELRVTRFTGLDLYWPTFFNASAQLSPTRMTLCTVFSPLAAPRPACTSSTAALREALLPSWSIVIDNEEQSAPPRGRKP